jgi:hypothetical protein
MSAYTPGLQRTQQLMSLVSAIDEDAWSRVQSRAGAPNQLDEQQNLLQLANQYMDSDRRMQESMGAALFGDDGYDQSGVFSLNSQLMRHEDMITRINNELRNSNMIPDQVGAMQAAITGQAVKQAAGGYDYSNPWAAGAGAFVDDIRKRTTPVVQYFGLGLAALAALYVLMMVRK